jgi:hypothetical protein
LWITGGVAEPIEAMYGGPPGIDTVVGIAASGALDEFATLTEEQLLDNIARQVLRPDHLVLIGRLRNSTAVTAST